MDSDPDPRRRDSLPAAAAERPGGELQIAPYVSRCNLEYNPDSYTPIMLCLEVAYPNT